MVERDPGFDVSPELREVDGDTDGGCRQAMGVAVHLAIQMASGRPLLLLNNWSRHGGARQPPVLPPPAYRLPADTMLFGHGRDTGFSRGSVTVSRVTHRAALWFWLRTTIATALKSGSLHRFRE